MKTAIFPGSFDPFSIGHASIVRRALPLFDKIIIGIGINENKKYLLPVNERVKRINELYSDEPKVEAEAYSDLTVDFAMRMGATYIVKGIRSVKDFEYERDMANINRRLTGVETLLLFTEPTMSDVSSTVIRELARYGKDISAFLPTKETNKTDKQ